MTERTLDNISAYVVAPYGLAVATEIAPSILLGPVVGFTRNSRNGPLHPVMGRMGDYNGNTIINK